jgi:hypothetical protein
LSQNTDDEGTKQKWRQKDRNGRKRMRHKERNCRRQMRNKTKVKTDKEVAEDRWRYKHELLFLTEEMVLQAFASLPKQLLVSD